MLPFFRRQPKKSPATPPAAAAPATAVAGGDVAKPQEIAQPRNQDFYKNSYAAMLKTMRATHSEEVAMELVVGGQREIQGKLELNLLKTLGLKREHTVVDVGCGSGRLTAQLAPFLTGHYVGTDILQDLIDYAAKTAKRPDWAFHCVNDSSIPAADASADFICFFSVFTHILDEDAYRYLQEAKRVIKPGGKIVVSYLEFSEPWHWPVFETTLADKNPNRVLNKFMSIDAFRAFCAHLDLEITVRHTGSEDWVVLEEPIAFLDPHKREGITYFGQSVVVMEKKR